MNYNRAYEVTPGITIEQGCAVVQGDVDNRVKNPEVNGAGDFIGVKDYEKRDSIKTGHVGITIDGLAKVRVKTQATAGKIAVVADEMGRLNDMATTPGIYTTCGVFLQSGGPDSVVDCFIRRGCETNPTP